MIPRVEPEGMLFGKPVSAFPDHALAVTAVMMMPAAAMTEANRLELDAGDAGRDVQPGLALHADRLQRIGIAGTADQKIAAAADADRRIGADAAIGAGEFAVAEPAHGRVDGPGELGLRGDAEIDADAPYGRHIGLGATAGTLEDALEARDRTDDEADILSAPAFEDAGLDGRQRLRAGERTRERRGSDDEGRKSHGLNSARRIENAEGQEGSAVSKTRRSAKQDIETSQLWRECLEA